MITHSPRPDIKLAPADLEELADLWGLPISLPGNKAGWAYVTLAGRRYKAWLPAPEQVA